MLNDVSGYYIEAIAPYFFSLDYEFGPLAPGINVFATISLSEIDTLPFRKTDDGTFAAIGFISSWTYYLPDGKESDAQGDIDFTRNAVSVGNCARIRFTLIVNAAAAIAQINTFTS